jgi:hypothetical protein
MIHYSLQCDQAHEFDGWFASAVAFDAQAARGLVECPTCGSVEVCRGLMAPSLPKKGNAVVAPQTSVAVAGDRMPAHMRVALQRLRSEVEQNCDYVGDGFADAARRIHAGDEPARGIYGETTQDQAEALAEDGIAVARIPWVPRADG